MYKFTKKVAISALLPWDHSRHNLFLTSNYCHLSYLSCIYITYPNFLQISPTLFTKLSEPNCQNLGKTVTAAINKYVLDFWQSVGIQNNSVTKTTGVMNSIQISDFLTHNKKQ